LEICFLLKAKTSTQQQERSTVCIAVYLMSEVCLTIDLERNATAQQIINIIEAETELGLTRTLPLTSTQPVFALWLCSSQLEVQLRPVHKPVELATKWPRLVNKYGSQKCKDNDEEPVLYFRRNVFFSRRDEEQIKEPKIMELLYAEAKKNVLDGKLNLLKDFFKVVSERYFVNQQ
jgi:hypothetical protein